MKGEVPPFARKARGETRWDYSDFVAPQATGWYIHVGAEATTEIIVTWLGSEL